VTRPLQVCVWLVALSALGVPLHLRAQEPERPSFSDWLTDVRVEALARGIRQDVVDEALGNLAEPLPVIIERDRSQAEVVLPLEAYVNRRLTRKMIASAREMFARQQPLLMQIGTKYGVSPRVIVSIWGVESNFGRFSGVRPTVAALATLAWDPRRATFFRTELFNALEILNRGDIELSKMTGSWAGAMGQPQFMPSSYLQYAEDYDGDGRRDIWSSPADVFASIANYLKGHGWSADERWGREVSISSDARKKIAAEVQKRDGTCQATRNMTAFRPLSDWAALGVRAANGTPLPKADINAALVSGASRHFLVYGNYDVLLAYNCAHAYAVSVALLADRIGGDSPAPAAKPAARSPRRPAARKPAAGSAAVPVASAVGHTDWAQ
jgi:peptidoglycan lytic transglycosylase B